MRCSNFPLASYALSIRGGNGKPSGAPAPGQRQNGKPTRVRLSRVFVTRGGTRDATGAFCCRVCVLIVPFGESPHVVAKGNVWDNKHTLLHWTRFQGWSSPGNDIFDDHAPNSLVDAQRPGGGYRPNATLTEHVPIPQEWAR